MPDILLVDWVFINIRALPELLLSLVVLILVIYGSRRWIGKVSSVMLILWVYYLSRETRVFMFMGGNGLLLASNWRAYRRGCL